MLTIGEELGWQNQAACKGKASTPLLSWDATPSTTSTNRNRAARLVCDQQCPVKWACLKYALDTEQEDGVWGGMLPKDRMTEQALRKIYGPEAHTS